MSKITFRYLYPSEAEAMLHQLFAILHTNMSRIAPTGCSYEENREMWLSYLMPALQDVQRKILLMYAGEKLAGYFQYRIDGDTLQVEEVEIRPEFQRTMVFYRCCQFLLLQIPNSVQYISSYVRKENHNSISIHKAIGMMPVGENKSGTSWYYRGERAKAAARFLRK